MGWIRAKTLPDTYGIGKTYAYGLLRQFTAVADPEDYIRDGKILIVRQESFETWWRSKGEKKK